MLLTRVRFTCCLRVYEQGFGITGAKVIGNGVDKGSGLTRDLRVYDQGFSITSAKVIGNGTDKGLVDTRREGVQSRFRYNGREDDRQRCREGFG